MSTWGRQNNRRRRQSSGGGSVERDHTGQPLDRDYGYGYSEEGRPITGITDGDVFDPQAEIIEPKGATTYHDLSKVKGVKMCAPDAHDLQPDGEPGDEIPGHQAMSCSRCPFGQMIPVK